ncbi:MAG: amidohydrolase family protein [Candidatus Hydrogenedentes bacterium]|nr:amidohydrolase family protein [Candidatus Hydrogenedentota bacterium]
MRIWNAQVVTRERVLPGGGVDVVDGRIARVLESCDSGDIDLEGCYLLPGLIDIHTHPTREDGVDPARLAALCDEVRSQGTAGFLFAPANAPVAETLDRLHALSASLDAIGPDRGCLGIHLEGPYVAPAARGGFEPEAITDPEAFPLAPLLEACGGWARYLNISPEIPGGIEAIRECRRRGLRVSMGHSAAERDTLLAALDAGVCTVCHTFNTGSIMRYKEPGVLDVTVDLMGLASDRLVCELICDGTHVDPVLVRLLYRAKGADGIALITDSILGGRIAEEGTAIDTGLVRFHIADGVGRNEAGGLVGSTLTMARAACNFMAFAGCGPVDAARAAALTPARVLGVDDDYGSVEAGRRALFCVLDCSYQPRADLGRRLNGVGGTGGEGGSHGF